VSFFDSLRGMFSPKQRAIVERRRKAREELDSLLSRGLVEKVLMFPAEFGGPDDPRIVTYLPAALVGRKRAFDAAVRRRVEAGEDVDYKVTPEYDGDSFVPARLHMAAGAVKEVLEVAPHRTWDAAGGYAWTAGRPQDRGSGRAPPVRGIGHSVDPGTAARIDGNFGDLGRSIGYDQRG
jgi:hypothetical protein